jgi:hypothetical protein
MISSFNHFFIYQLSVIEHFMIRLYFQPEINTILDLLLWGFYISITNIVIHMVVICHVKSSAFSNGQSGELSKARWPRLCQHWYEVLKLSHIISKCLENIFQLLIYILDLGSNHSQDETIFSPVIYPYPDLKTLPSNWLYVWNSLLLVSLGKILCTVFEK